MSETFEEKYKRTEAEFGARVKPFKEELSELCKKHSIGIRGGEDYVAFEAYVEKIHHCDTIVYIRQDGAVYETFMDTV